MSAIRKALLTGVAMMVMSALFLAASCSQATVGELSTPPDKMQGASTQQAATTEKSSSEETTVPFVGHATVEPRQAPVGTSITVSGTGFPSGEQFDLVWHTVEGSWDIRGDYQEEYHGRVFDEVRYTIAEVKTDAQESFSAILTVPEDYGFNHNITIEQDGQVLNRVGFDIEPTVSIEPASGPIGTPITVTMAGIGWDYLENSWTLMYDNQFTGLLTAVTTKGTAKAVIPATGGLGKHMLRIAHGAFTFPYLNTQQSPRPERPIFTVEFTITDGPPVLPAPAEDQGLPVEHGVPSVNAAGPVLWVDPAVGPIETQTTLYGEGFPPGQDVEFLWYRIVGNRISGTGWDETSTKLGTATVQVDGTVSLPFIAPDDLGGGHRIEAVIAGDKVAETAFVITPLVFPLEVYSGLVGTPLMVHLKGVGWTETANIYHLVYDNAYLGYACGFNTQGDVTIYLPLTGEPGWHFIDLYPGIYKGKEVRGVRNFRIPQLTYKEDHPGERLPAFRFAVQVTG